MVGAIFHAPRSSVAVPIALPCAGRANSLNDDERNFLKAPSPMDFRAASAARGFNWGLLVDLEGFEPPTPEPKSDVLPLHHRSIKGRDVSLILFPL